MPGFGHFAQCWKPCGNSTRNDGGGQGGGQRKTDKSNNPAAAGCRAGDAGDDLLHAAEEVRPDRCGGDGGAFSLSRLRRQLPPGGSRGRDRCGGDEGRGPLIRPFGAPSPRGRRGKITSAWESAWKSAWKSAKRTGSCQGSRSFFVSSCRDLTIFSRADHSGPSGSKRKSVVIRAVWKLSGRL